jgi:predicted Holliday junction resolvase-like endonuclease
VIFIEVKTGASGLSTRERQVRDAIQAGNVEWTELRVPSVPEMIRK